MPVVLAAGLLRLVDRLMNALRVLIGVLLVASVVLNLANVIGRKFLHAPISGAEEVMNFLMVALVFLGAGAVAYDGTHINMEILIDRLPPPLRDAFKAFAQLAAIAVAIVIITLGIPIVRHLGEFNERSQAANVPLWIPQATVPIGLALLALGAAARLVKFARQRRDG
jgi:C4-dicarboxylate transporter DctQ subunit